MKYLIFILLCFVFSAVEGQNLNGIWQGKLTQEPGGCFPEYFIELQIQTNNKEIDGVSYDYYDTTQFVKLNFSGVYSGNSQKKILITEKKVIKERIPSDCTPCLKTYDLSYSKQNNEESLTGKWAGEDMGTIAGCPPGFIYLKKVKKSAFEEKKLRETELAKVFILDSAALKIDFYDNGVIDGDSVSVFFDNKAVISKRGLSLTPLTVNFTLIPSKEYEMVISAESMGSISPNTALVLITSGTKRYEILISSNEEKNSSIKFIYKKE